MDINRVRHSKWLPSLAIYWTENWAVIDRVYISAVNKLSDQRSVSLSEVETDAIQCGVRLDSFTVHVTAIIADVYDELTISYTDE